MGIPLFGKALESSFGDADFQVESGAIGIVSTLSIDANSIFHPVISFERKKAIQKEDYDELFEEIKHALRQIVKAFAPKDLLTIAVDGPTPMSKVRQQKQRRYERSMDYEELNTYDSNILTPGTEFMILLDEHLEKLCLEFKKLYGTSIIAYSSHLVPGEGEHKMLYELRKFFKKEKVASNRAHVVYGNDSDLVLLALGLERDNFYVCKDSVKITNRDKQPYTHKGSRIYDINRLAKAINAKMAKDNSITEFVYACSFLGNDFLPRSPLFADIVLGMEFIMKFLSMFSILNNLDTFINILAQLETFEESESPISLAKIYSLHRQKARDEKTDFLKYDSRIFRAMRKAKRVDFPTFRSLWYLEEFGQFEIEQLEDVNDMVSSYLRGLEWTFQYYLAGQDSVTWLWYYPYNRAPLFTDIDAALSSATEKSRKAVFDVAPVENEIRHTALHQLLMVMPQKSVRYVPEILHNYYTEKTPLRWMMPISGIKVDSDFCEVPFQANAIVTDSSYYVVCKELQDKYFQIKELNKYINTTTKRDTSIVKVIPPKEEKKSTGPHKKPFSGNQKNRR